MTAYDPFVNDAAASGGADDPARDRARRGRFFLPRAGLPSLFSMHSYGAGGGGMDGGAVKLPAYLPPGGKLAPMPDYGQTEGGSAHERPVPYDPQPAPDDAADLMRMIPEKVLSVFEKARRMQRDGRLPAEGASQAQSEAQVRAEWLRRYAGDYASLLHRHMPEGEDELKYPYNVDYRTSTLQDIAHARRKFAEYKPGRAWPPLVHYAGHDPRRLERERVIAQGLPSWEDIQREDPDSSLKLDNLTKWVPPQYRVEILGLPGNERLHPLDPKVGLTFADLMARQRPETMTRGAVRYIHDVAIAAVNNQRERQGLPPLTPEEAADLPHLLAHPRRQAADGESIDPGMLPIDAEGNVPIPTDGSGTQTHTNGPSTMKLEDPIGRDAQFREQPNHANARPQADYRGPPVRLEDLDPRLAKLNAIAPTPAPADADGDAVTITFPTTTPPGTPSQPGGGGGELPGMASLPGREQLTVKDGAQPEESLDSPGASKDPDKAGPSMNHSAAIKGVPLAESRRLQPALEPLGPGGMRPVSGPMELTVNGEEQLVRSAAGNASAEMERKESNDPALELTYGSGGEDEGLLGAAYTAALLAGGQGFQEWLQRARAHPGFDPALEAEYAAIWKKARDQVVAEMGPQRGLINSTVNSLKFQMGMDSSPQAGEGYYNHPEYDLAWLAAINPKGYMHAIQCIAEIAKRAPKEAKAGVLGWLQRACESIGRGIDGTVQGALESLQLGSAAIVEGIGDRQKAESLRASVRVQRDLRAIAEGTLDPVERRNWFDTLAFGFLESAPRVVAVMHPAGRLLLTGTYTAEAYDDFQQNGFSGSGAFAAAAAVGAFSTAVEYSSELLGKIPGVGAALARLGIKPGAKWWLQWLARTPGRLGTEIGEQALQDLAAPAMQEILAGFDLAASRSKSLAEEWREWKQMVLPGTALMALPLALLGAGLTTRGEMGHLRADALTRDRAQLSLLFDEATAARIAGEADAGKRLILLRDAYDRQTKEQRLERLSAAAKAENQNTPPASLPQQSGSAGHEQGQRDASTEGSDPITENPIPQAPSEPKGVDLHLTGTTEDSIAHKLQNYSLNPDHPAGGPKAKWFRNALGFTRENADELAKQLVFDPTTSVEIEKTQFGTRYNQIIEVRGANGRVIPVKVAWIRNLDGVIRIVSTVPTRFRN